jgi:hypothetical protein
MVHKELQNQILSIVLTSEFNLIIVTKDNLDYKFGK